MNSEVIWSTFLWQSWASSDTNNSSIKDRAASEVLFVALFLDGVKGEFVLTNVVTYSYFVIPGLVLVYQWIAVFLLLKLRTT